MEPVNEKREKLKEFYFRIKNCCSCELGSTRTNFVFGSGNSNTSILFIGEAPGKNEDLQGRPFVGQAGKILDGLLAGIGLSRNEVFIANVLKCRPPANRDPALTEIDTCKPYLFEQIEIIDPAIICTLGKYSTQLILDTTEGITKLRGNIFKVNGRLVLPINHPAAALYAPSRISVLKEDFNRIKSVLDGLVAGKAGSGKAELDKTAPDKSDPDKTIDIGNVLETEKVSEAGEPKNSAFVVSGEISPAGTKQNESTVVYPDGMEELNEKVASRDKGTPNEQAGLTASELSNENKTANKNENDKNQNSTNQDNINQDRTNQDNINQQLGLF
jgi:DNA polymerase